MQFVSVIPTHNILLTFVEQRKIVTVDHHDYRLMYDITHQLCWIAMLSSSGKDHRAHGLQPEVKAHQQEVRSWSSGQGCTFIKVIYWPTSPSACKIRVIVFYSNLIEYLN